MNILALDTSTEACSAALMVGDAIIEDFRIAPRQHTELVLSMMDNLLTEAGLARNQLDGLVFGRGPGAFTGVRIATGVAQGVAFALDIPVAPVSTLAALAQGALRESGRRKVLAVIDARMDEVYAAAYVESDSGLMQPVADECVCAPGTLPVLEGEGWYGAGSGWQAYADALKSHLGSAVSQWDGAALPHARDMLVLGAGVLHRGEGVDAARALPVYLRDNVAKKAGGRP